MATIKFTSKKESDFAVKILESKGFEVIKHSMYFSFAFIGETCKVVEFLHSTTEDTIDFKTWLKDNPPRLENLQTGMWVTTTSGRSYQILRDLKMFACTESYDYYANYNSDLTHITSKLDIIKVHIPKDNWSAYTGENLQCIWERNPEVILSLDEIVEKLGLPVGTKLTIK